MFSVPIYSVTHCGESVFRLASSPNATVTCKCGVEQNILARGVPSYSGVKASVSRCLCVKKTMGPLSTYSQTALLHIGISDSQGRVYNFDEKGIHVDASWEECLSAPIIDEAMLDKEWDEALANFVMIWQGQKYHSMNNNCYEFVVAFLNFIIFSQRSNWTKDEVASKWIVPVISNFEVFLELRKEIDKNGFATLDTLKKTTSNRPIYSCDICGHANIPPESHYRCSVCVDFDVCAKCKNGKTQSHLPTHPLIPELLPDAASINCDGCGSRGIQFGNRYKCRECEDFDLCKLCFEKGTEVLKHKRSHQMIRL